MKERKTNKGAAKRVILKTIGMTLLIDISVIMVWGIIFFLVGDKPIIESIKIVFLTTLIGDILPIYFGYSIFINQEKNKFKAETAENIFRKGDTVVYPKVFPKKGHFRQRKFFEEELPKIAEGYYANLYEDGKIEVVAKIRDLNQILTVEYISKENFTDAYEVLETTLTENLN